MGAAMGNNTDSANSTFSFAQSSEYYLNLLTVLLAQPNTIDSVKLLEFCKSLPAEMRSLPAEAVARFAQWVTGDIRAEGQSPEDFIKALPGMQMIDSALKAREASRENGRYPEKFKDYPGALCVAHLAKANPIDVKTEDRATNVVAVLSALRRLADQLKMIKQATGQTPNTQEANECFLPTATILNRQRELVKSFKVDYLSGLIEVLSYNTIRSLAHSNTSPSSSQLTIDGQLLAALLDPNLQKATIIAIGEFVPDAKKRGRVLEKLSTLITPPPQT